MRIDREYFQRELLINKFKRRSACQQIGYLLLSMSNLGSGISKQALLKKTGFSTSHLDFVLRELKKHRLLCYRESTDQYLLNPRFIADLPEYDDRDAIFDIEHQKKKEASQDYFKHHSKEIWVKGQNKYA